MNVPHLCVRCSNEEISSLWHLKGTAVTADWGNATSFLLAGLVGWGGPHTREKYDLPLPVCAPCLRALQRTHAVGRMVRICGTLAGALWLGYRWYRIEPDDEFFGPLLWIGAAIIGGLIGFGVGTVLDLFLKGTTRTNPGSFNGRYFRFCNPEFERQFAALNPAWVKPNRRQVQGIFD